MSSEESETKGMMCNVCKEFNIAPPFGCYMCDNYHMQCKFCNDVFNNKCGICNKLAEFYPLVSGDENMHFEADKFGSYN